MAAVKGKDTKPEMVVRRYLFARGLRYRVNNRKLPGAPDLTFRKYRTVVFVDGCFWHGHEGCRSFRLPKTNADFWRQKIAMNIARDYANGVELRLAGWRVIRVWECDIMTASRREAILSRLYDEITRPFKLKRKPAARKPSQTKIAAVNPAAQIGHPVPTPGYLPETNDIPLAAEPRAGYSREE